MYIGKPLESRMNKDNLFPRKLSRFSVIHNGVAQTESQPVVFNDFLFSSLFFHFSDQAKNIVGVLLELCVSARMFAWVLFSP